MKSSFPKSCQKLLRRSILAGKIKRCFIPDKTEQQIGLTHTRATGKEQDLNPLFPLHVFQKKQIFRSVDEHNGTLIYT